MKRSYHNSEEIDELSRRQYSERKSSCTGSRMGCASRACAMAGAMLPHSKRCERFVY